jgi:hypothetical protein
VTVQAGPSRTVVLNRLDVNDLPFAGPVSPKTVARNDIGGAPPVATSYRG